MSVQLLDKTRKINKLLHNNNSVWGKLFSQRYMPGTDRNSGFQYSGYQPAKKSLVSSVLEWKRSKNLSTMKWAAIDSMLSASWESFPRKKMSIWRPWALWAQYQKSIRPSLTPSTLQPASVSNCVYVQERQPARSMILSCEYGTTVRPGDDAFPFMRRTRRRTARSDRKSAINTLLRAGSAIIHIFDELDGMEVVSWLPARSQTAGISPVPLSSTPFEIRECGRYRVLCSSGNRERHLQLLF